MSLSVAKGFAIVLVAFAAGAARGQCGPGAGSCGTPNGTPGCDDVECCELVCSIDPFCCQVEWDAKCAEQALAFCDLGGCPGTGDCYTPGNSPGCNDLECCQVVCAIDSFCCEVQWDGLCADLAGDVCCPADTNGDGLVNVQDLVAVITAWGTADADADVNGDGAVDVQDMVAVITAWGEC